MRGQADQKDTKIETVTLTVGTQTLTPTTDTGAFQQWRAIPSSHRLELQRLQHRISNILQDAATGFFPLQKACSALVPYQPDFPGNESRPQQLQHRSSGDFQPTDENLRGPPMAVLHFKSPTPKYRPDTEPESAANAEIPLWPSRHPWHASHRRGTVKGTKKAEISKKAKASPQAVVVLRAAGQKVCEAQLMSRPQTTVCSEERTPAINSTLDITPGHDCSCALAIHPTSTSEMHTNGVLACCVTTQPQSFNSIPGAAQGTKTRVLT